MFSVLSRLAAPLPASPAPARLFSIWEITSWILPMAPEHFRRVLAETPDLPQGSSGAEGGTRWFSATDLAALRRHFSARARAGRYRPPRPEGVRAPILAMAGPQGGAGRTTALLHLATAAALNGWRVLVIDADPGGQLAPRLGARLVHPPGDRFRSETSPAPLDGALALIARAAARHLRRMNATRLDLGEPPLAVDDRLSAALALEVEDLIQPTAWPGLEVMAAGPLGLLADPLITAWRLAQRSWQPWSALAEALDEAGLRQRYDLIFCDTGRGLGPLALATLASADVLLAPLPLRDDGPEAGHEALGRGFQALSGAFADLQAEAQTLARALGRTAPAFGWRRLAVLPTRAGPDAASRLAGFAAKLAGAAEITLLPDALPEIAALAEGQGGQLYDLDYRRLGRLAYTPLREATEAAFRGLAGLVGELWQEDRQNNQGKLL